MINSLIYILLKFCFLEYYILCSIIRIDECDNHSLEIQIIKNVHLSSYTIVTINLLMYIRFAYRFVHVNSTFALVSWLHFVTVAPVRHAVF